MPRSIRRSARIQNDLFDVEADLCLVGERARAARGSPSPTRRSIGSKREIDRLNADLAPLQSFILPGGSAGRGLYASRAHHLPARRAHHGRARDQPGETVTDASLKYVNRLSDFLFVAGRHANDKGARDVLWVPGQNR